MTASILPTWAADRDHASRDRAARQRTADYERVRYQRRQAGDWAPFADTGPVRHHLQALREAGLTLAQIGGTAGVSVATLVRAMKADRMTSAAANAIMAITAPANGSVSGPACGPGLDTDHEVDRRQRPPATVGEKLQTLAADGWTLVQIAVASGLSERAVYQQIHRQVPPMRSTTAAIDRAYDQLVDDDPGDGYIAVRARLRAERAGWQPSTPPPAPTDIDEVAVDRAVAGERLPLRPAEQHSVLTRLAGCYPDDEIGRRLGLSARTVLRYRSRHQLPAYTGHLRRPDTP
ncbi:MAG: hypothetical protein ABI890_14585 [Lapillicoccus sp.]